MVLRTRKFLFFKDFGGVALTTGKMPIFKFWGYVKQVNAQPVVYYAIVTGNRKNSFTTQIILFISLINA